MTTTRHTETTTPIATTTAPVSTMTCREAMREAIGAAIAGDDRVVVMGEDVGRYGGCFAVTAGLLDRFGERRVRDTPLSESGFVGAGVGAAIGGLRPIVEIMTVNFSLLALDQIMNTAATFRHMSGGQIGVPLVIRTTTGGGRQLAAQHSHSLDGWFAHIPGIKVVTPSTADDFRWMLGRALDDPDPVLIFEHGALYGIAGPVSPDDPGIPNDRALVRRTGDDLTIVTYGGTLVPTLDAAERLADRGIDVEVVDLRSLRPLDDATIVSSVAKTHRVVIVDEGWRSGGISAEISSRIVEQAFFELDAPPVRVCTAEVPLPYPSHLEQAALPNVDRIIAAAVEVIESDDLP